MVTLLSSWTTFSGIYARIYHENRVPTALPIPVFRADEDAVLSAAFDLSQYFRDEEEGTAGLSYQICRSMTSGLLTDHVLTGDLLTAKWSSNAFGTARIAIRATDSGASLSIQRSFSKSIPSTICRP